MSLVHHFIPLREQFIDNNFLIKVVWLLEINKKLFEKKNKNSLLKVHMSNQKSITHLFFSSKLQTIEKNIMRKSCLIIGN